LVTISSGWCKGTKLKLPSAEITRPSSARVREAVFSMLAERIGGASVADVFAGSGAMGLEALSRGASSVIFFEQNPKVLKILQQNTELVMDRLVKQQQFAQVEVRSGDFRRQPSLNPGVDVIWADPPYLLWSSLIGHFQQWCLASLSENGLVVFEASSSQSQHLQETFCKDQRLMLDRSRKYSDTVITILKRSPM